MESFDLINELQSLQEDLRKSLKKLRETGTAYAEAEKDYKILLRQEVLKMRDAGEAIGVISLTCYGIPEVAEARQKRDIAEAIYKANQESINVLKLQIKITENQISREWVNPT